jgi:hypothetical protein
MQLQTITQTVHQADHHRYQKLENELMAFAHMEGKQQGLVNKPATLADFKATVLNSIQTRIQEEIYHNAKENTPISGMVMANTIQREAKGKIIPLQSMSKDLEHEKQVCEGTKKQCTPNIPLWRLRKIVYCAAGLIAITEGFLAYEALRIAGLARIPSIATATGIAIAIACGTHYMARYIKHAQTRKQLLLRYALVLIPAFIGFWALGTMRADGYTTTSQMSLAVGEQAIPHAGISGLTLAIISFLLFLVGLLFSVRFAKSKEEENVDTVYDTACQQENECDKKMAKNKQAIQQIQDDANKKSEEALMRYEYVTANENKLKSCGTKAVNEFITTCLRYKTDSITPEFFANPPQLQYKTFFDTLKKDTQ